MNRRVQLNQSSYSKVGNSSCHVHVQWMKAQFHQSRAVTPMFTLMLRLWTSCDIPSVVLLWSCISLDAFVIQFYCTWQLKEKYHIHVQYRLKVCVWCSLHQHNYYQKIHCNIIARWMVLTRIPSIGGSVLYRISYSECICFLCSFSVLWFLYWLGTTPWGIFPGKSPLLDCILSN